MKNARLIGSLGQWLSFATTLGGLIYEALAHASVGYWIISAGSIVFAVSTKIKYLKERKKT